MSPDRPFRCSFCLNWYIEILELAKLTGSMSNARCTGVISPFRVIADVAMRMKRECTLEVERVNVIIHELPVARFHYRWSYRVPIWWDLIIYHTHTKLLFLVVAVAFWTVISFDPGKITHHVREFYVNVESSEFHFSLRFPRWCHSISLNVIWTVMSIITDNCFFRCCISYNKCIVMWESNYFNSILLFPFRSKKVGKLA